MKRKAFTLTEVVVSILVLGIVAASITLSSSSSKQSAKREAERTAAKMNSLISSADRIHTTLWINVEDDRLEFRMSKRYKEEDEPQEEFKVTNGCKYSRYNTTKHLGYNVSSTESVNTHQNFTMNEMIIGVDSQPTGEYNIQVKDSESSLYYIVISKSKS